MGLLEAVQSVFSQYATFSGRARRSEYWYFTLFNVTVAVALAAIGYVIGTTMLSNIYSLAVFIPGLAVSVRRLHDVGKSGWWYFIIFVPIIGFFWMLYLYVQDSVVGENEYGPNPKVIA